MKQLPIHFYTNEIVQKQELDLLFFDGLKYRGHQLMVENSNQYISLPQTNDRWALVNNNNEKHLISNVCLHRQSQLLEGSGKSKFISCKIHCWTYEMNGKLKSAPHFKNQPEGQLQTLPLNNWNGLLFDGDVPTLDLKKAGIDEYINFEGYKFHKVETTEYNYNWKTFSEVYLENYHVFSMHPGLKRFVTPSDLEWHFGEDYSVQKVGIGSNLETAGSSVYQQWHDQIKEIYGDNIPRYGAIWIYLYPNIMIEWYPHTIAISTIYPVTPNKCVNHVEYYYKKDLYDNHPQFYHAIEKVYEETAKEDEQACLLLDKGRKALYINGENEMGPCDEFLEAGLQHFYDYINKKFHNI
jgi:choline monooxygenase